MTNPRDFTGYLTDMRDAAQRAVEFLGGTDLTAFAADVKTVFAIARALEIIGEAAKRVPDDVRARHPSLPWREMARIRDKLIHHYTQVDLVIVWKTVTGDLPGLITQLDTVIAAEAAPPP